MNIDLRDQRFILAIIMVSVFSTTLFIDISDKFESIYNLTLMIIAFFFGVKSAESKNKNI